MIDTKKLQELDQEYDQNLRNIYRNREQLEDDFHLFMARTDSLKESVYQASNFRTRLGITPRSSCTPI